MGRSIEYVVPAKLNLFLKVGPASADGFHPLASWFVTVGLFDQLRLSTGGEMDECESGAEAGPPGGVDRPARPEGPGRAGGVGGEPTGGASSAGAGTFPLPAGLALRCDDPSVPTDGRNLVAKAVAALVAANPSAAKLLRGGLTLDLVKKIPSGGGLGGGSADAAAALVGLDRLWNLGLSTTDLATLAGPVGSDVPFFIHALHQPAGGPAPTPSGLCEGRGERFTPLPAPAARWAVLLLPDLAVSTAAAYRRFDDLAPPAGHPPASVPAGLRSVPPERWGDLCAADLLAALENDLEAPAFALAPALSALRRAAERLLNRPVRMSGSGSTLFTLYDHHPGAEAAASACASLGARTVAVAVCPV